MAAVLAWTMHRKPCWWIPLMPSTSLYRSFNNLAQKQTALYYAPKQQPWGDALLEQSAVEFLSVFNWEADTR